MKYIQKGYEGSSIQQWDLAHGIVRVVRDGCEYVRCRDLPGLIEQCKAEEEERRRRRIAEEQYNAYFGGE